MKKFLLTLATVALAATSLMAQNTVEPIADQPDRMQTRALLSKNPTGMDIPTGIESPQVVETKKHECKDHKDGKPCTKPADQQCDDCKAKAAAKKHECEKAAGMKHECKKGEGQQCEKAAGMKHECKKGAGQKCEKAEGKLCEKGAIKQMHKECKDHKDGKPCTKPADQQCDDCKAKAAAKKN